MGRRRHTKPAMPHGGCGKEWHDVPWVQMTILYWRETDGYSPRAGEEEDKSVYVIMPCGDDDRDMHPHSYGLARRKSSSVPMYFSIPVSNRGRGTGP